MSDFLIHQSRSGDRWDLLAATYYGDASQLVPLLKANPEQAMMPVLPEGIAVRVPILDVDDTSSEAGDYSPWRSL